jgi:hypothetical protein
VRELSLFVEVPGYGSPEHSTKFVIGLTPTLTRELLRGLRSALEAVEDDGPQSRGHAPRSFQRAADAGTAGDGAPTSPRNALSKGGSPDGT